MLGNKNTWIFQGNPNKYKILESISEKSQEYWNLRQHSKDIHKGDRVLFWICGEQAGVYAIGTILTEPRLMSDSEEDMPNWINPIEGRKVYPRVLVNYDVKWIERPLIKKVIQLINGLEDLGVCKQAQGTNFFVKPEEWKVLKELLQPFSPISL